MYGARRARMLARKSSYMWAAGQKVDSAFGILRCTNNSKSYFLTKALVQCLNHAQPECLHIKAPTNLLKAKKDSVLGPLRCANQKKLYFPLESACSEYEQRTAKKLGCKSTYMQAESQTAESLLGSMRCTNNKTHYFPTKTLVQCIDGAQPECLRVKAPLPDLKAKK